MSSSISKKERKLISELLKFEKNFNKDKKTNE